MLLADISRPVNSSVRCLRLMRVMKLHWFAFVVAILAASPVMAQRSDRDALVLRGNVRDIKFVSNNSNYVDLEVALDIEFVNTGAKPIIFLKPQKEREAEIFWPGAISLSLAKFLAERGGCDSTIWVQAHLPSISTAPEFQEMAKRLDQPSPLLTLHISCNLKHLGCGRRQLF